MPAFFVVVVGAAVVVVVVGAAVVVVVAGAAVVVVVVGAAVVVVVVVVVVVGSSNGALKIIKIFEFSLFLIFYYSKGSQILPLRAA